MDNTLVEKICDQLSLNRIQGIAIIGFFEEHMIPEKYLGNFNEEKWARLKSILLQVQGTPDYIIETMEINLVCKIMEE